MKIIKLIIALFICSTSFGQITNITGAKPKIRTLLITPTSDTLLVVIGDDIYKMAIVDLPSGGGGGSGGGNVYKYGTPTANQVAMWRNDSTIQGLDTATLFSGLRTNEIALKAPKASPTFTGTLTASAANFTSTINNSSWTANYIPYSDASKNLVTSSAFYHDGTRTIQVGGTTTNPVATIRRDVTGTYTHFRLESSSANDAGGYMQFGDGTSSGYAPYIIYATDNVTGNSTFHYYRVNDGASSIGAIYNVTNQAGSAALANATAKLYEWRSNGTAVMTLDANGKLGIGTTTPAASSLLDVSSTTKGFLPPRMTGTQAEAISSPAEGLLIYSTDGSGSTITSKGWWGYEGSTWVKLN